MTSLVLDRERPWGRVYRYGDLWFKVNGGGTTYEPALLALLESEQLRPDVIGLDPGRGWSLVADAGTSFRDLGGERAGSRRRSSTTTCTTPTPSSGSTGGTG